MSTLTISFLNVTDGNQTELPTHIERCLFRQGLVHVDTDDDGAHYTLPAGTVVVPGCVREACDIDYNELASIARECDCVLTIRNVNR